MIWQGAANFDGAGGTQVATKQKYFIAETVVFNGVGYMRVTTPTKWQTSARFVGYGQTRLNTKQKYFIAEKVKFAGFGDTIAEARTDYRVDPIIDQAPDRHVRRSGADYATGFMNLLPQGQAWPREPDSVLVKVVRGLSQVWGSPGVDDDSDVLGGQLVDGRAGDLLERESDPRFTIEMLTDWERNWGLPDPCYAEPLTIGNRRIALLQRMTIIGSQSRQFFIDTAAFIGYNITISEYRPFMVGLDRVGDNRILLQGDYADNTVVNPAVLPQGNDAFTKALLRFDDVAPVSNGNDQYTKVMLNFPGTDGSTTFVDDNAGLISPPAPVWTPVGNAQIDTSRYKFGTSSGLFDNSGSYIWTPAHPEYNFGSGDWTIDCWFYCDGIAGAQYNFAGQCDAGVSPLSTSFLCSRLSTGVMYGAVYNGLTLNQIVGTTQFTNLVNVGWHHYALVKSGSVIKMYIDGIQEGGTLAVFGSVNDSTERLSVGTWGNTVFSTWPGSIAAFRLTVGIPRWVNNFTPPNLPYSSIVIDDVAQGATGLAHVWTAQGNAKIDTSQAKFGLSSGGFDGTDSFTTPDHVDYTLGAGSFAIDLWFLCIATGGITARLCGQNNSAATDASFRVVRSTANKIVASVWQGGAVFSITTTASYTDAINPGWHHLAFLRFGDTLKLFIDGVQDGGDLAFTGSVDDSSSILAVGNAGALTSSGWVGWIGQFRYSVGTERWVTTFTPLTIAYDITADGIFGAYPYMVGPPENRFYWTVHVGSVRLTWFRASEGQAGVDPHLRIAIATDLECLLRRWAPAHTDIIFDYSIGGISDPLSGTGYASFSGSWLGGATLPGSGSLRANTVWYHAWKGQAVFAGESSLYTRMIIPNGKIRANLAGAGSLVANAVLREKASALFSGAGSLQL